LEAAAFWWPGMSVLAGLIVVVALSIGEFQFSNLSRVS